MKGQLAGNTKLYEHKATKEELGIAGECRDCSDKIARRLSICKETEISDLLKCYDLVYRIGYKKIPDSRFIVRCKDRAFKAWKSGKANIEESRIIDMIASDAKYYPEAAGKGWSNAYTSIMWRWVDTLKTHGTFPDTTSYEKYQRLSIIMFRNIDSYIHNGIPYTKSGNRGNRHIDTDEDIRTSEDYKHIWYDHNKVKDIRVLPSQVLRSYRRFISSLPTDILGCDESMNLDTHILTELSTRTDLDPYDREAFRLALQIVVSRS